MLCNAIRCGGTCHTDHYDILGALQVIANEDGMGWKGGERTGMNGLLFGWNVPFLLHTCCFGKASVAGSGTVCSENEVSHLKPRRSKYVCGQKAREINKRFTIRVIYSASAPAAFGGPAERLILYHLICEYICDAPLTSPAAVPAEVD
jgi:hypothetical protein